MNPTEWTAAVVAFQEAYPSQDFNDRTMKLWFRALQGFTLDEIARALIRCLGEREWLSSYALAEAIRDERRERSATRSTVLPLPAERKPPPPEVDEIIAELKKAMALPDDPGYGLKPEIRKRVEELAGYHKDRLAEESTAPMRSRA